MPSIKRLFSGPAPAGITASYTAPAGKKVIIKSITINNQATTDQALTIWISSFAFIEDHVIKAKDSVILPAAGLILEPGEQLFIGGDSLQLITRITGQLFESSDQETPINVRRLVSLGTTPSSNSYTNTNYDVLIKSVTFCNRTNVAVNVTMIMGGAYIISKSLKARDTLTIPFLDQILIKGESLQVYCDTVSAASCIVTGLLVRNNA